MGEIVNLHRIKKLLVAAAEQQTAKENRLRHARTAAEKASDRREAERTQATLRGKRIARDSDGDHE